MPAPKVYATFTILPREWLSAVGSERHQCQGSLVIVANVKRDCDALLTDRGVGQYAADDMVRGLRVANQSNTVQNLIDAGVLDPAKAGVYVYYQAVKDYPIGRLNFDGSIEVVGHWRYDSGFGGRGLYVEPVAA